MKKALELDQFFTCTDTVKKCLNTLKDFCIKNQIETKKISFLEPSAGNGQFIKEIESIFNNKNILAYDIEPKNKNIIQQNFLELNIPKNINMITIGNPPFGYKSGLAIKFINKSSEITNIIAFILPLQFTRWNVQKQINANLKLVYSSELLPKNSFFVEETIKNINCIFQIWINKEDKRFLHLQDLRIKKAPSIKNEDFILYIHNNTKETLKYFDKKKYEWDFAIHRQGFYDYSKKIFNPEELIKNRQYLFVKYVNPISKEIFKILDFEKLSNLNTVIKGYSNSNVVAEYEKIKKEKFNQ